MFALHCPACGVQDEFHPVVPSVQMPTEVEAKLTFEMVEPYQPGATTNVDACGAFLEEGSTLSVRMWVGGLAYCFTRAAVPTRYLYWEDCSTWPDMPEFL